MASLVNNLGGERGFGENSLYRNDDGYTSAIDITPVFENGLNLFGTVYTSMYVNTNGNVTFNTGLSRFTPEVIGSNNYQAIIAPFWADVDTRSGELVAGDGTSREVDYGITAYRNYLNNDVEYYSNFDTTLRLSNFDISEFDLYSFSNFLSQASNLTGISYTDLNSANLESYYTFLVQKQNEINSINNSNTYNPSGNSTGSNLVWYDVDPSSDIVTVTWDDVGYYNQKINKTNAFQLQLIDTHNGSFDIKFIYEDINWTTGRASGGSNGLGGVIARAGYSAGNGSNYYELPFSGDQNSMLNLENYLLSGQTQAGIWSLTLNDGEFFGIGLEGVDDEIVGSIGSDVLDGRSGNDTIYGGLGDDTITGGEGDDTLYGEDGNDNFFSGYGNDIIHGGAGIDTVNYLGRNYNDLTFEHFNDHIRVFLEDSFSDIIYEVENIGLANMRISFDSLSRLDDTQGEIVRLYNGVLGRNPDAEGFNYWLDELLSSNSTSTIQDISNSFANSSEYSVRFGAQSNEEFINQLYNNILGRNADNAGYTYWLNEIGSSGNRSGMVVSFTNSVEYIADQEELVQDYINNVDLNLILI